MVYVNIYYEISIECSLPTPTQSPTTLQPTINLSKYLSSSPITLEPTLDDLPFYNVSSSWISPLIDKIYFLSDPYGRFKATVKITIIDPETYIVNIIIMYDIHTN